MDKIFLRPKLESGVRATEWSPCSTYTSSLIRQTADYIMLNVASVVSGITDDLEEQIQILSGDVLTISGDVDTHTEQIGQLIVTARGISGRVSTVEDQIGTVSGNVTTLSGDVTTLTGNLVRIDRQVAELTVTANEIKGQVSDIEDQVLEISGSSQDWSGQINELSATVTTHTEQIGQLTVTAQAISGQVSNISDTVTELNNKVTTLSGDVEDISTTVSGHTEQIGSLTVTAQAISGRVSNISDQITTITDNVSGLQDITQTHTEQIGSLTLQADLFETEIYELQENIIGSNLIPINGWVDGSGEYIYPTTEGLYTSTDLMRSPVFWLDAGSYVASSYNSGPFHLQLKKADGTAIQPTSAYTDSEDTYENIPRQVDVFVVQDEGDHYLQLNGTSMIRPKCERGSKPTAYTQQAVQYNSLITQTSQQITLEVQEALLEDGAVEQFKRTGIDITNGLVEIDADNTVIKGNLDLKAQDDADALSLSNESNIETTVVTSHNVGTLSQQSNTSTQNFQLQQNVSQGGSTVFNIGYKYLPAHTVVTPGKVFNDMCAYVVTTTTNDAGQQIAQDIQNPDSATIELKLVRQSTTYTLPVRMETGAGSRNWIMAVKPTQQQSVEIQQAGTYDIYVTVKLNGTSATSPFTETTRFDIYAFLQLEANNKTVLGADGLYSFNGDDKFIHFSSDGFHASQMNSSGYHSTVGTMASDAIGGVPTDIYTWPVGGNTGPAHIATFRGVGDKWCLAQSYANVVFLQAAGTYSSSNPYMPYPSTDVIVVDHSSYGNMVYINLDNMAFNGHIVTIRCINDPVHTTLLTSGRFIITRASGSSYSAANAVTTEISNSTLESAWSSITLVYRDVQVSGYTGQWLVTNVERFVLSY